MIRIKYDDLNLDGGIPNAGGGATFCYNGKPFTGIIQYFYSTGELEAEDEFVDSYKNGHHREWYKSGKIRTDYYERFNAYYGEYKYYYENGTMEIHSEYSNEGVCLWTRRYNEQGLLIGHWIKGEKIL